jgi:hypothetical protein
VTPTKEGFAYRTSSRYGIDPGEHNERRADQIEHAIAVSTDKLGEDQHEPSGVYTDLSDMLASVRHFCDRAGIDYGDVDSHAQTAYEGDVNEDGGVVKRDTERFPEED